MLSVLIVLLLSQNCFSQAVEHTKLRPFGQLGIGFGGSLEANYFNFASGYTGQLGLMKQTSEKLHIGIGLGMENMNNNYFFPIGIRCEAQVFKNENFKYLAQLGYAPATYIDEIENENIELDGGPFLELGRLWTLPVGEQFELMSTFAVKYQFANLEFEGVSDEFTEKADYIRVGFSLGLRVK